RMTFAHDALGRETSRSLDSAAGIVLDTGWDGEGRVTRRDLTVGGRPLRARGYSYRGDDRLTAVTDLLEQRDRTFELDPVGRPLGSRTPGRRETYAYDPVGNLTQAQWPDDAPHPSSRGARVHDGGNLRSAGALSYTFDAAGRVVERRRTRLSRKPDVWRYTWDAEDRLTACVTPDGATWSYAYDVFGRRTAKRRHAPDGSVVAETLFTWDDGRLVEQVDSATGTCITWEYEGHHPIAQAEHRPRPRTPAAGHLADDGPRTDVDSQADVDSRFFAMVTDLIGTPTELVDESGAVAWQGRALQWGATAWNRDATAYTPIRFPGQYADPETGLHYNVHRHYDPETARYVSQDPLGLDPAPNPVGYVNDPLTEADPLGLSPCLQTLENLAQQVHNVLPVDRRQYQTVSVIQAITPQGPRLFVAGTSRVPLNAKQLALAKQLNLIPIPSSEYLPKPPKGERGGHAEQNILHFLNRRNQANGNESWLPTHGAASRPVCPDICLPVLRASAGDGRLFTFLDPKGDVRQFSWPDNYLKKK
ncbi:RHS repeat domain-containing protein, partial [Streptomyces sp. NPDC003860]